MNMKKIICMMAVAFLVGTAPLGVAVAEAESATFEELEKKISEHEKTIEKQQVKIEKLEEKLDKNYDDDFESKREWEQLRVEMEDATRGLKKITTAILWVIGMIGIGGFISIKKYTENQVRQKVDSDIGTTVEREIGSRLQEQRETFENIIKERDMEKSIRENERILVISKDEDKQKQVEDVLDVFKNKEYRLISDNIDKNGFDMILFNDVDGKMNKDEETGLKEKMENLMEDDGILYFYANVGKRENLLQTEKTKSLSFASSKSTLYENMMTLFKYKKIILERGQE